MVRAAASPSPSSFGRTGWVSVDRWGVTGGEGLLEGLFFPVAPSRSSRSASWRAAFLCHRPSTLVFCIT